MTGLFVRCTSTMCLPFGSMLFLLFNAMAVSRTLRPSLFTLGFAKLRPYGALSVVVVRPLLRPPSFFVTLVSVFAVSSTRFLEHRVHERRRRGCGQHDQQSCQ